MENVCGAQKWVGRARWHFGSFYLWGDVPALMPIVTQRRMKFPANCGPRMWSEREYQRLNDGKSIVTRQTSSRSQARKAASAHIAKIPFHLARHIAAAWLP